MPEDISSLMAMNCKSIVLDRLMAKGSVLSPSHLKVVRVGKRGCLISSDESITEPLGPNSGFLLLVDPHRKSLFGVRHYFFNCDLLIQEFDLFCECGPGCVLALTISVADPLLEFINNIRVIMNFNHRQVSKIYKNRRLPIVVGTGYDLEKIKILLKNNAVHSCIEAHKEHEIVNSPFDYLVMDAFGMASGKSLSEAWQTLTAKYQNPWFQLFLPWGG